MNKQVQGSHILKTKIDFCFIFKPYQTMAAENVSNLEGRELLESILEIPANKYFICVMNLKVSVHESGKVAMIIFYEGEVEAHHVRSDGDSKIALVFTMLGYDHYLTGGKIKPESSTGQFDYKGDETRVVFKALTS